MCSQPLVPRLLSFLSFFPQHSILPELAWKGQHSDATIDRKEDPPSRGTGMVWVSKAGSSSHWCEEMSNQQEEPASTISRARLARLLACWMPLALLWPLFCSTSPFLLEVKWKVGGRYLGPEKRVLAGTWAGHPIAGHFSNHHTHHHHYRLYHHYQKEKDG